MPPGRAPPEGPGTTVAPDGGTMPAAVPKAAGAFTADVVAESTAALGVVITVGAVGVIAGATGGAANALNAILPAIMATRVFLLFCFIVISLLPP